jgi:GR25 family glycosyltransferase involved in LPS biosynthesis
MVKLMVVRLNMINEYFKEIYCINLDERKDRWNNAQAEFLKIKLNQVKRFSAIKDTKGAIGCRKSHIEIIKLAKKNNFKNVFIFEDDISFVDKDIDKIHHGINQLRKIEWDLFYLGATFKPDITKFTRISDNLIKTNFAYATHAYAINSSIFDLILKNENKIGKIDVFYSNDIIPSVNTVVLDPIVAVQSPGYSNILNRAVNYSNIMINDFEKTKKINNI